MLSIFIPEVYNSFINLFQLYKDFFEDNDLPKFDVIVGNPPYQGPKDGSNSFWKKFIDKSINILQPSGIISMVTPSGWTNDTKAFKHFKTLNPIYINLDCKKYFKNSSTFSWWVIKNELVIDNITRVLGHDLNLHDINFNLIDKLPNVINTSNISILNKLTKFNTFDSLSMSNFRDVSKVKTEEYCYPSYNTVAQPIVYLSKDYYTNDKKVIFTSVSTFAPFYDNGTIGVARQSVIILVNSILEGTRLEFFLNSTIIRFYNNINRIGGFNGIHMSIPLIPLDREFTDNELYEYFNISKEEIEYIENNLK